jgi:3-phosphoshikimate 1-carboxyvinyltransferase
MITANGQKSVEIAAPFGSNGTISVPGSKSISNRVLLLAALSEGTTRIKGLLKSDDTEVMLNGLSQLGVGIQQLGDEVTVRGCPLGFPNQSAVMFLGNAGTAVRSLVPVLSFSKGHYVLKGVPRMYERPIRDQVESLVEHGADITYIEREGFLPLEIRGGQQSKFDPIFEVRGNVSSQYLSGLLLSAPLLKRRVEIRVIGDLVSKPYVKMTLDMMSSFGVEVVNKEWREFVIDAKVEYRSPGAYVVEGDASSASYFFAAGLLSNQRVSVTNIERDSIQGDIRFLDVLENLGARVESGPGRITVRSSGRRRIPKFDLDLNHIPDAAMTLAVLALFADGECHLRNIGNWRVKETDRLFAMATELRKFGATVTEGDAELLIKPPTNINSGVCVATYDDHRMAMSFSLVALSGTAVTILEPGCVNKTFPSFFQHFDSILRSHVISIDGPSGSGKGSVAKAVALKLGFDYLDSGAIYRAIGMAFLDCPDDIDLDESESVEPFLNNLDIQISSGHVMLNGKDVTSLIREERVSMAASRVAASAKVREKLLGLQRLVRRAPGLVADGRDMGTTVFPDSLVKVYLTASAEERAERRYKQLIGQGKDVKMEGLVLEMKKRDEDDMSRSHSPLKRARSATEIDSTDMTIEEVSSAIVALYEDALNNSIGRTDLLFS